jgi:hypothetical protein
LIKTIIEDLLKNTDLNNVKGLEKSDGSSDDVK